MKTKAEITWAKEAEKELKKVPFFARPLVRRKVEERVKARGGSRVALADYREAEARMKAVLAGKTEGELQAMMPRSNQPGAPMVAVEVCHHELSDCPNLLLPTAPWREALEKWVQENEVSERLRARVKGDRVLYHQKLRLAVAGCPNSCSRPQIADVGVVGMARPEADPALCQTCGACAEVCPDHAVIADDAPPVFDRLVCQGCGKCRDICPTKCITLSAPAARILVGGKLGRHPHLAEVIGEAATPGELIKTLDKIVEDYLAGAQPEERFADYWIRTRKEKQT